jgi:hypothetical protein
VAVGGIPGGEDVLGQVAQVELLHQDSHRWFNNTLVRIRVDPNTTLDKAVIKAADALAGAFNTVIVDE